MENNKIDPVTFCPAEVTENILKYLSSNDLLKASLVSTDWYNFVAGSSKCMKKITIKVDTPIDTPEKLEILTLLANSPRKYENFETTDHCPGISGFKKLIDSRRKQWKRINFARATFRNEAQALKFLGYFEKTVEDLTLSNIVIKRSKPVQTEVKLMFPKLKKFTAGYIPASLFSKAFTEISSLEEFVVWGTHQSVASLNTITNLLKTNHKLQFLSIWGHVANQILHQSTIKDLKFQLKQLSVTTQYHESPFHDAIQKNLVALIESQSKSLEKLYLGDWMGVDALQASFRLPKLTKFTIRGLSGIEEIIDWEEVNLPTNQSVLDLTLHGVPEDFEILKKITSAVPNTTQFTVTKMDAQLLKHIHMNLKNLQILNAGIIAPNGIPTVWHPVFKHIIINCWKI